jgi:hypothetical protein
MLARNAKNTHKLLLFRKSEVLSDIPWDEMWSLGDAVRRICLPQNKDQGSRYSDSRLLDAFKRAAAQNALGPLSELFAGQNIQQLFDDYKKLVSTVDVSSLRSNQRKYPTAIWIRSALEAKVSQADVLKLSLLRWNRELRNLHDTVPLYLYLSSNGAAWRGPKQTDPACIDAVGFTSEQVLSSNRETFSDPFARKWKLKCHKTHKSMPLEKSQLRAPIEGLTKKNEQRLGTLSKKSVRLNSVVKKKSSQLDGSISVDTRERLESYEKKCGRLVMNDLAACLKKEAEKQQGKFISPTLGEARLYKCDLSLDELVKALRSSHSSIRACSPSNVRRALSAYVACPRGRPRMGGNRRLPKKKKNANR